MTDERLRDEDGSGLTRAERDLHYHKLEGGSAATYHLWKLDDARLGFPAGYEIVMTFQAADIENAADLAHESYEVAEGDFITDEDGNAFRFDGSSFQANADPQPIAGPLPSPSEVIANPAAYLPEPGDGNGQDHGNKQENGR